MMHGETIISGASIMCDGCGAFFGPRVMRTAGWYVGTECGCNEGQFSRETEYFSTEAEAEVALKVVERIFGMLSTNYHIAKNDEVAQYLNLKWKDVFEVEDIDEIIEAHPEAKIRR